MSEALSTTQSLNFNRDEVVTRCKADLNFLAALAMPLIFTFMFPPVYLALWGLLQSKCTIEGIFRLLLALPRGHAKTTFVKIFVLYLILFTDRCFILILCASGPKAENFLADVCDMLDESNIQDIFGNWRLNLETDQASLKKFSFMGRDIILAASGQGSVRGLNIKHRRPDTIIMDDIQDKENAESAAESNKLLQWIQSTVMKLRDPRRCFFLYIGNKYRVLPGCVCVLEKLEKNDLWIHIVTGAILSDGKPLWPELHPLEMLLEEFQNDFNMGTPEIFLAEIMNDVEANLNALIDLTKIPISPYDRPEEQALLIGKFVIIDVATNKIGADDTVIGLWGLYVNLEVNLEEIEFGSLSPLATIQKALEMCFRTGANLIAVENAAYQSSLLFWFDHVCKQLEIGDGLHFVEVTPVGKKNGRILDWLKQLLKGSCFLGAKVRQVVFDQALSFKPAKTNNDDNILDMGSYWQQVIEKYRNLIALPASAGNQEFARAKVIDDGSNCSF